MARTEGLLEEEAMEEFLGWDSIGWSRFYRNMWSHLEPYVSQRFRDYLFDRGVM